GEDFPDGVKRSGQQHVVTVEPRHDFACSTSETLVGRVRLSLIWFTDPISEFGGIFAQNIDAAIGRTAVDDDVFKIGVMLVKHRVESFTQKRRLIIRRRYDRYTGGDLHFDLSTSKF